MAIHKCRKCIWSNKISPSLLYCIFPRCIRREETTDKVTATAKKTTIIPKARTTCDDKRKGRKRNVSKKT
ncbi:hypothetical protein [Clostridium magnum]|uniref:Uncharacterized protein n=1 Tax=Clostridium magnum DSM 2767 TaxID=1121326 RepID=A0A162UIN6_9CLOT|nr:hypothetical protein [Clostridium magnum]KZL93954.1 hypothetical protein CLMAG_10070 [Clostridium magnum DSM 2767]SHH99267.1 hypothetical protein SAMN02745944_02031 [Clostridium magnum DSM 2767]